MQRGSLCCCNLPKPAPLHIHSPRSSQDQEASRTLRVAVYGLVSRMGTLNPIIYHNFIRIANWEYPLHVRTHKHVYVYIYICMYVYIYIYIYIHNIQPYIWIYCIVCVQAFVYDTHTCIPMNIWNVQVQYIHSYRMMILYDTQHDNKAACMYIYIYMWTMWIICMYSILFIIHIWLYIYIILHPQISTVYPASQAQMPSSEGSSTAAASAALHRNHQTYSE